VLIPRIVKLLAEAVRDARLSFCLGVVATWAVFLVRGQTSSAEPTSDADIFNEHSIGRIEIELPREGIESLRAQPRRYVRATVRVSEAIYREVGLHLKGSKGSFREIDQDKPAFTLSFDRYASGQRFCGLSKIHLNNSVEDSSYLKEQLASDLFGRAGVPVPRVAHALVVLNGRDLGLYVLKEGFTREFLARHFVQTGGALYEPELGNDVNARMKQHLGAERNDDPPELRRLAAAALETDPQRRWEQLQECLDLDRFLSFMAMEIMVCHWDGYCLGRNNFRVYHEPGRDKIHFLPTGMDQAFAKSDMPWKADMAGLVARAIMEAAPGRARYEARFKELFGQLFSAERLTNRVNQLLDELKPVLPRADFAQARQAAAELCGEIAQRELYLHAQLSNPGPVVPSFVNGRALLAGWQMTSVNAEKNSETDRKRAGSAVLGLKAENAPGTSCRTKVILSPGSYTFQGRAKVNGVLPLPFGTNQGASLRVGGKSNRSAELTGSTDWEQLAVPFEVRENMEEIVLICELRASAGEAWFEPNSLLLIRQR
jgi:hypothetical protein